MTRFFSTEQAAESYRKSPLGWVLALPTSKEMLNLFGITSKSTETFADFLKRSYPQFYRLIAAKENLCVEEFHTAALTYYKKSHGIEKIIEVAEKLLPPQPAPNEKMLKLMNQYSKCLSESITGKLGTTLYDRHADNSGLTEYEHGTLSMINMTFSIAFFESKFTLDAFANVIAALFHDSGRLIYSDRVQGHANHHKLGAQLNRPLGSVAEKTALLHTTIPKHILHKNVNHQRLLSGESTLSSKPQLCEYALKNAKDYLKSTNNPDEIVLDAVAKRIIIDELAKIPRNFDNYPLPQKSQIEALTNKQLRLHFVELVNTHGVSKASRLFEEWLQQAIELMHVEYKHALQV